jgi:hypothetical protein
VVGPVIDGHHLVRGSDVCVGLSDTIRSASPAAAPGSLAAASLAGDTGSVGSVGSAVPAVPIGSVTDDAGAELSAGAVAVDPASAGAVATAVVAAVLEAGATGTASSGPASSPHAVTTRPRAASETTARPGRGLRT